MNKELITFETVQQNAQYALDVETCKTIDGLDAWQLWQFRTMVNGQWSSANYPAFVIRNDGCGYRRHPHADNIISYHKCSERDKKRWQCRWGLKVEWVNICECKYERDDVPMWREDAEYRLKPETITINGKEYAAPLRVAPYLGAEYWWYSSICGVKNSTWSNDCMDRERLSSNCVFVLHDDCQAVSDAFNAILMGDDNE